MSNLSAIDGANKKDKAAEALRELERSLEHIIKTQDIFAKIIRAKFDSLVKVGFSEAQALELCKNG